MMGLSSPIKARSSGLGSRALGIEMDSSQELLSRPSFCGWYEMHKMNGYLFLFFLFKPNRCRLLPLLLLLWIPFLWCFKLSSVYYKSIFWTCRGQFNDHYAAQMAEQGNKANQCSIFTVRPDSRPCAMINGHLAALRLNVVKWISMLRRKTRQRRLLALLSAFCPLISPERPSHYLVRRVN